MGGNNPFGEGNRGRRVGDLDDEADRAEALFHVGMFVGRIAGEQHRGAHGGLREFRVFQFGRGQHDAAQRAAVGHLDALQGVGGLHGAEHGEGDFRLGQEAGNGLGQVGTDLVVGLVAVFRFDAAGRHEDRLRGGAHLAGVERQREGQVAQHGLVGVGRVDDDVVDTGQLGIDAGLAAVVDEPLAEDIAAGEVDRLDGRVRDQLLRRAAVGNAERHQVGIDAVLGQHGADGAHGDRGGQDGVAVRLDDHGIARGQRGKQAGVGVPGREGAAADDDADAMADQFEVLLHDERRVLALRLFPGRFAGHEAHFAVSVGNGFEATVLSMRRAGLEGHHPALAGGHHHGVGDLETLFIQTLENFQADAGAAVGTGLLPAEHGLLAGGDQCGVVADGILHIQIDAVGRLFAAHPAALAGLAEFEFLPEMGLEGFLAIVGRGFAVGLRARHLVIGRPVAACPDGVEGAVERGAVFFQ